MFSTVRLRYSNLVGRNTRDRGRALCVWALLFLICTPIQSAIAQQSNKPGSNQTVLSMAATEFAQGDAAGCYVDKNKWLAVDPNKHKEGRASRTFPFPTGVYHVTIKAVGENDGRSSFVVSQDQTEIGTFACPLSQKTFEEGPAFNKTWKDVSITEGAMVGVLAKIGSKDGKEYSRGRWSGILFEPADESTMKGAKPFLVAATEKMQQPKRDKSTSPTKSVSDSPLQQPRQADGNGTITISGELKAWHKITLTMAGPYAHEQDNLPNPFTDLRMSVLFSHADGSSYNVPGYFAGDGRAGESSAESGTAWRAHFSPDKTGAWTYAVSFVRGPLAALDQDADAAPIAGMDGKTGDFTVAATDKQQPDLRFHGRLQYVKKRYLRCAGSGRYFLKVGADAPETLLAFADFDNTIAGRPSFAPLKTWSAHVQDWQPGDPTWKDGRGKGLIGAINYLSGKGCNAFSFLTYNAGGDGDNVWPFIHRDDKLHYDCSKLDQWATVLDHGTAKGMYLHFKMQETENDDHNTKKKGFVPTSLDGGNLGPQRKLYCRELIARFGHNLALNWNLGEENTQTTDQVKAMINYIADLDAYDHNIVLHTYPNQQDKVYRPLLGDKSKLTGTSLQNSSLKTTHEQTEKWVSASQVSGKPWVVAFDESGSAAHAQCPDLGYRGFDGHDKKGKMAHTQHEVRKYTLWGTLMAGGAGCEYYFGYQFEENDILCQDWRSRDKSWDYCRIAINFFHDHAIPFWEMENADELVGNSDHGSSKYCLAKNNDTYLVYLPDGGQTTLDLSKADGEYSVQWFNPRSGGELDLGSVESVTGGQNAALGSAPNEADEDWLILVRKNKS